MESLEKALLDIQENVTELDLREHESMREHCSFKAGGEVNLQKSILDALVTTANIVALVMMAFAYMEQWYLWTLVNLSSVVLWTITLLTEPQVGYAVIPIVKYSFYFINGINGIRIWRKLSREQA